MPTFAPCFCRPGSANFFKNRYNAIIRSRERRGKTDAAEDAASACEMFAATAAAPAAAAAAAAANACVYRVLSVVVFLVFIHKNHADIEITDGTHTVAAHSLR